MNYEKLLSRAKAAHKMSTNNKIAIKKSNRCGCFCCESIFSPEDIAEWIPESEYGPSVTAVCPRCGVDSVIPIETDDSSGMELLAVMKKIWF